MFNPDIAYIFITEVNTFYLSKFKASFAVVLIHQNKKFYFTDSRYYNEAKESISDFIVMETTSKDVFKKIEKMLNKDIVIGLESNISFKEHMRILECFSKYSYVNITEGINKLRMIKNEFEVQSIVSALQIAEKAFNRTLSLVKEGITEDDLAIDLEHNMRTLGGEDKAFDTIVAFGDHSAVPHAKPSNRKLKNGESILFDFGTKVNGYLSDTTRTVLFGKNTYFQKDYAKILNMNKELISMVSAGETAKSINDAYVEMMLNYYSKNSLKHSVGHGVGLEIHEEPFLNSSSEIELKEGMVITIEPGLYKKNYGIRIEDMILVKKHDNIILSEFFNKELIII